METESAKPPGLDEAWSRDHRYLWAICYRMTGVAADADELVSETFTRALERPPARTDLDWRPWLTRVAINLARDLLRKRKRRGYTGPWLPGLIELDDPPAHEPAGGGRGRYDLLESASMAFLIALEELSPTQRAVLLLRDVFDYSTRETATALELSEANVKTSLHRARKTMEPYDEERAVPGPELQARATDVLRRFMTALAAQDLEAIEALLHDDVVSLSDGGGVYNASPKPMHGARKVARLYIGLARHRGAPTTVVSRLLNGMPALVVDMPPGSKPRDAPRVVFAPVIDATGKIRTLCSIMAPDKLAAL
jgi:RNA polymerase sigma-70 factor (ECF subfamily)